MDSWLDIPLQSDFSLHNIPFGIIRIRQSTYHAATRLGDYVVDLYALSEYGFLNTDYSVKDTLRKKSLNEFIALGKGVTNAFRQNIQTFFSNRKGTPKLEEMLKLEILYLHNEVELQMPVEIGDYTDFYSSIHHATNVGSMFRPDQPLLPNWKHLPVAYHGRASSIVLSGTPVQRPLGQFKPADAPLPVFGPTQALDFELEMAFVIGKNSQVGKGISTHEAKEFIFGFLLFNDWSARDIQSWEYQPLGPFLSKNFLSSVSPWIVTSEALEPFRIKGPDQDVPVLPYLQTTGNNHFDVQLEVYLKTPEGKAERICLSNFKHLYWNIYQQLAHHTVGGCNIRIGDIMASGTISGPEPPSRGCLLELTWRGQHPILLSDGTVRKYLEDGDTVIMKAFAEKNGVRIGFGEVNGTIVSHN